MLIPNTNNEFMNGFCEICDDFRGGTRSSFCAVLPVSKLASRNLAETDQLVALAGLGGLLPGYTLVFTRKHINNMGQLAPSDLERAEDFIQNLKHEIR